MSLRSLWLVTIVLIAMPVTQTMAQTGSRRTSRPMEEIGSTTGEELNWMQQYGSAYLQQTRSGNIIPGFPQVELVHSTSGWGPPGLKKSIHAFNATLARVYKKLGVNNMVGG